MDRTSPKIPILLGIPIFACLAIMYLPVWEWMYNRWMAEDSYSSHGFLIPLISLWLLWNSREKVSGLKLQGSWWGLGILLVALVVHLLSGISRIYFTSAFFMPIALYGMVILFLGKKGERWCRFPVAYLFFMVPFPQSLIANLTLDLKLMASEIATMALNFIGIIVVRDGSILTFMDTSMVVGDVCSGLRSLVSLIAFGVPFIYLIQTVLWRKILGLIMLFPLAFMMNVLRIFFLGIVANFFGSEMATGKIHDASGLMIFVLDLLCLWWITDPQQPEGSVNEAKKESEDSSKEEAKENPPILAPEILSGFFPRYAVGVTLFLSMTVVSHLFLYQSVFEGSDRIYTAEIPQILGEWKSNEQYPVDKRTIQILETEDILFRHYQKQGSSPVLLCVVASASSNRKVAHPPEICYRGAGWEVTGKKTITLSTGHKANLLTLSQGNRQQVAVYWYKFGDLHTYNYYYHQAHALLNFFKVKKGGIALIRLSAPVTSTPEETLQQIDRFAKDAFSAFDKYLP